VTAAPVVTIDAESSIGKADRTYAGDRRGIRRLQRTQPAIRAARWESAPRSVRLESDVASRRATICSPVRHDMGRLRTGANVVDAQVDSLRDASALPAHSATRASRT
jgi:hypothetical protein